MFRRLGWVVALACAGCGSGGGATIDAAATDSPVDTLMPDGNPLGSQANPAPSCVALRIAQKPTGVYYLQDPVTAAPFEAYCDQDRDGGGWTLIYRSVLTTDGSTAAFWTFNYAARFTGKGKAMAGANYYAGTVYRESREYMDTITDLQGTTAVALSATVTGFNATTMQFTGPVMKGGDGNIYANQFASGWAASDYDGDPYVENCAIAYNNVAQHYSACWTYNLGVDAEVPFDDGGAGPHVSTPALTALQLSNDGTTYSRVKEIARYGRW